MNNDIYDYQNEVLNEPFDSATRENFNTNYINNELLLKTLLFGIIFYILTNNMMIYFLKNIFGKNIEINLIQTMLFVLIYYFLNISL
jgi:hypothetical protein